MRGLHIPEERGIAGKLAAALYLTGAATALLLPLMPGVPVDSVAVLIAVAAAGGVWGLLALTVVPWERVPPIVSHLSSFAGLPITAVVMAETGGATSPARFYLFFMVFYCCYFYPPREAAFFVAGAAAVHALPVLYESDLADSGFLSELLVILPTYAVLGGLISISKALTNRLREESLVLALTDDLTGVSNRRAFEAALDALVAGNRAGDGTGLLLVDLDDFKEANTLFGHTGGDRVLCAAAIALRDAARGNDMVARLGGDEFAILATAVTETGMRRLADRLFECVRRANAALALDGFELNASAGFAVFPTQAANATELFERADLALAQAKLAGKATWKAAATAEPTPPVS
jgi:diguanylate cyclase (GGDEF)-like protein